MIQQFRKKPVVIDAIEYTGNNGNELNKWSNGLIIESPVLEPSEDNPTGSYVQTKTLEGVMTGNVGDMIIKGVNGEFYPCKPDIFEKTYELVAVEDKEDAYSILKKHLIPCFNHELDLSEYLVHTENEIIAAMEEYKSQSLPVEHTSQDWHYNADEREWEHKPIVEDKEYCYNETINKGRCDIKCEPCKTVDKLSPLFKDEIDIEIGTLWCEVIYDINEADKKGIEAGEFIPYIQQKFDLKRKSQSLPVEGENKDEDEFERDGYIQQDDENYKDEWQIAYRKMWHNGEVDDKFIKNLTSAYFFQMGYKSKSQSKPVVPIQKSCKHTEWIESDYTDTEGNNKMTAQCTLCGKEDIFSKQLRWVKEDWLQNNLIWLSTNIANEVQALPSVKSNDHSTLASKILDVLNKHLQGVEIGNSNNAILSAMEEYKSQSLPVEHGEEYELVSIGETDVKIIVAPHPEPVGQLSNVEERIRLKNCIIKAMVAAEYQDENWKMEDTADLAVRIIQGEEEVGWLEELKGQPVEEDAHITTQTFCPTCGSKVKVGGEGETHFYIPVEEEYPIGVIVEDTTTGCNFPHRDTAKFLKKNDGKYYPYSFVQENLSIKADIIEEKDKSRWKPIGVCKWHPCLIVEEEKKDEDEFERDGYIQEDDENY